MRSPRPAAASQFLPGYGGKGAVAIVPVVRARRVARAYQTPASLALAP
ncbi:MAG: hypothetical protein GXY58_12845 [Planctomycetaceae bacterium]|nr:hypothetical protein [Planctomycetaceae bacterium]